MQYLDSIAPEDKRILPPTSDTTRYDELVLESLADALLDAALLYRYEITGRVSSGAETGWKRVKHKAEIELLLSATARRVAVAGLD